MAKQARVMPPPSWMWQTFISNTGIFGSRASIWKQQSPSAIMIGFRLGADYVLSEQFDFGAFLAYYKPGTLKVTGIESSPSVGTVENSLTVKWMTLGLRFVVHF